MNKNILLLAPALLALAACSGDKVKYLCPQTAVVRELEKLNDYGRDEIDAKNLVSSVVIEKVAGSCEYNSGDKELANDPERGVDVNFTLSMKAMKGPRLGGTHVAYPFMITIVSPDQKIVKKEIMTADIDFGSKDVREHNEDLHVFIPLAKGQSGEEFRVLTGFQLTEDQLSIVRTGKPAVK